MKQYTTGIFIGRFQPIHRGHVHVIKAGLEHCEKLILMIGSMHRAPTVKNPWSFEQRVDMIQACLKEYDQQHGTDLSQRVIYRGVEDRMYDNAAWFNDIFTQVAEIETNNDRVALIGHDKDASTWYLKGFAQFEWVGVENYQGLNATPIRHAYFSGKFDSVKNQLFPVTIAFMEQFSQTPAYQRLCDEYQRICEFKADWSHSPYPPIFVTTDSVVICQNQVLLIKRGRHPGKDLWALPGGFLEAGEWIQEGLFRELREETSIAFSDAELRACLKQTKPFDHPDRAQLGRIITNGGHFEIPGDFPALKAADDAAEFCWYPLEKISDIQDQLHDDHYQIIRYFINRI